MTETALEVEDAPGEPSLVGGRYLAENGRWFVQLRVDVQRSIVSADLSSRDQDGPCELWLKTRDSAPAEERRRSLESGQELEIDLRDSRGGVSSGTITLTNRPDGLVEATFTVRRAISGLVPGLPLTVDAARVSAALRDVGLEIEKESGLDVDLEVVQGSEDVRQITTVLADAGLQVHWVGQPSTIDRPASGSWSASDIFSVLSRQVRDAAQAPLTSPAWELHLMLLSKTDRAGLLGIMFDFVDDLPRQGAAVFVEAIRETSADFTPLRVLATAVHELGHCLNLAHRFNREINLIDSPSFMNYDWIFRGGGHEEDYWRDFPYSFDPDEIEFLGHAPRDEVIPGGWPFGSARYWTQAARERTQLPSGTSSPSSDLQLWLTPPAMGTHFGYGQPVYLEVSLRNAGNGLWCVPRHVLDVKAGHLEILIRRRRPTATWTATDDREPFSPFMRRCFAVREADRSALRPGESIHDNVSLTFGSAGSPFAEPGEYVITPVLTLIDPAVGGEDVIEGAELVITVDPPESSADQRDADLLRRSDVGASLALGGAESLREASGLLEQMVERRRRDRPTNARPDGLLAAASRTLGIQADRRGFADEAARRLDPVVNTPLRLTLDPHTALNTAMLARRQRVAPEDRNTRVYVDLVRRAESGAVVAPQSVEGVLVSRPVDPPRPGWTSEGVAVLLDATAVPDGAPLAASVVVTGADGVTERVRIDELRLFADGEEGRPGLALATLARPVPAATPTSLPYQGLWEAGTVAEAGAALEQAGIDLTHRSDLAEDPAAAVADAEQSSPWSSVPQLPTITPDIDQVASLKDIICYITKRCDEAPPGQVEDPPAGKIGSLPVGGCGCSAPADEGTG